MTYCKHYESTSGWFSNDYCNISGTRETIPNSYFSSCKNGGYGCPWYENAYGSSSGCFITTITCDILGKDDHCKVMEGLRNFRNEILQNKEEYSSVLKMYDSVGPVVACKLAHDGARDEKAAELYSRLEGFVERIQNGEYKTAAAGYIRMTLELVSLFGLKEFYRNTRDNNFGYKPGEFDQKTAGHGKKMAKTIENQ